MELSDRALKFSNLVLDNFEKDRAKEILKAKLSKKEKEVEAAEDAILAPADKDKLSDKYQKWDNIEATLKKREDFEAQKEKQEEELQKNLMATAMGCNQNHSKEISIWERPFPEKISIVKDFKEKGNSYF